MSLRRPSLQLTLCFLLCFGMTSAAYPFAAERLWLENDQLAVEWQFADGQFEPVEIHNKLSSQRLPQAGGAILRLVLQDAEGTTRTVAASEMEVVEPPRRVGVEARPHAVRGGERVAGQAIRAKFRDGRSGTTVQWQAILREGANYAHVSVAIRGGDRPARLRGVELLDIRGAGARQVGVVPGSPVVIGQTFFGIELPFAKNQISPEGFRSSFECDLPLEKEKSYAFSAVAGVTAEGQLRRGFLEYLERERAVPYHPFLHYNCWYDLVKEVNEKDILAVIAAFSREMTERRGVALDSYVLDDGWDDTALGFWAVSKKKFSRGFEPLSRVLEKEHSRLGIWISPLGGYAERQKRTAEARKLGLVRGD